MLADDAAVLDDLPIHRVADLRVRELPSLVAVVADLHRSKRREKAAREGGGAGQEGTYVEAAGVPAGNPLAATAGHGELLVGQVGVVGSATPGVPGKRMEILCVAGGKVGTEELVNLRVLVLQHKAGSVAW